MKKLYLTVFLSIALFISGCADIMIRNMSLGEDFSTMTKTLPKVKPGNSRLFIYGTEGGPLGTASSFSIDNRGYTIMVPCFVVIDIEKGKHLLTSKNLRTVKMFPIVVTWNYGDNKVETILEDAETKYFVFNLKDQTLIETEKKQALEQLNGLSNYIGAKVSDKHQEWEKKEIGHSYSP